MIRTISFLIEFVVQTVFLLTALWIMIKVQKLNYGFIGLLGSAALASALDMIPIVGHFIAVGALLLCITKVTRSEYVDVAFTVFVGYALMFGMNLWLLGAFMGDLRPSAREASTELLTEEIEPGHITLSVTNQPAVTIQTSQEASVTQPFRGEGAARSEQQQPEKRVEEVAKYLSVRGITRNSNKSSVAIHTGVKTYTLFLGESVVMESPDGTMAVRFDELGPDWLVLSVEGEQVKLALR